MLSLFQALVEMLGFEDASEQVTIGERILRVEEVIAEGGYAYVHIAVDKNDASSLFALKRITCHCRSVRMQELQNLAEAASDLEKNSPPSRFCAYECRSSQKHTFPQKADFGRCWNQGGAGECTG